MTLQEFWDSLDHVLQHVIVFGTAVTAAGVTYAFLRKHIKDLWDNVKFMYNARAVQNDILEAVSEIKSQLFSNGGSSVRDSLDRIEQRQEFSMSFLKTQLNSHHKALFECDAEGRCIWANRPFMYMTGFSLSQLEGTGWINLVDPTRRDSVARKWCEAIENVREFDETVPFRTVTGDTYLVHINSYLIRSEKTGAVLGFLGEVSCAETPETIPIRD